MSRFPNANVITKVEALRIALRAKPAPWPKRSRALMVRPEHFRVAYAINPYMLTAEGELQAVDTERAREQWEVLRATYERLGFPVSVMDGEDGLPDMVFSANQSFPYWDPEHGRSVILSRMQSGFRAPEVPFFARWYEAHGYRVAHLESKATFEGNGDACPHPERGIIWGAAGPRTSPSVYDEIAARTGVPVVRLTLQRPEFYHLDTCFSILDGETVAVLKEAFDEDDYRLVREAFPRVIQLSLDESRDCFAGNCHSPDGRHVILHRGAHRFVEQLGKLGFIPVEVDTSEFLKSGGSVFCLKMMVF